MIPPTSQYISILFANTESHNYIGKIYNYCHDCIREFPLFFISQEAEKDECFKVELTELSPGAKLGRIRKTIVTIVNDDGMCICFHLISFESKDRNTCN